MGVSPSSILSIIGGALMALGGLFGFAMMGTIPQMGFPGSGMMGGMMSSSLLWGALGVTSVISVGLGAVLVLGGYSIYRNRGDAGNWGIAILVASIAGLVTMSGFFIGPVLGIIGGILALTKK